MASNSPVVTTVKSCKFMLWKSVQNFPQCNICKNFKFIFLTDIFLRQNSFMKIIKTSNFHLSFIFYVQYLILEDFKVRTDFLRFKHFFLLLKILWQKNATCKIFVFPGKPAKHFKHFSQTWLHYIPILIYVESYPQCSL